MKRGIEEFGSPDSKRKKMTAEDAIPSKYEPIDVFGLNGHVLRKIFGYCSVADLYSTATANDQLMRLTLDSGVEGRMFDFGELADCCHILDVFKLFGKQMTKIKIGERNVQYKERNLSSLDEICRMISTYCAKGTLKQLHLQYFHGTSIQKRYVQAVLPFLSGLESFTIDETDRKRKRTAGEYFFYNKLYNAGIDEFIEHIVVNAERLTSIEMFRVKISGRFFGAGHIRNLKCLLLADCNIRAPHAFITFLRNKPQLNSFKWLHSSLYGMDTDTSRSSNIVYELAADNLEMLSVLCYIPNSGYMDAHNEYESIDDGMFQTNYQLLPKFKNLKALGLDFVDFDCLKLLAQHNTVETLAVGFPEDDTVDFRFMRNFTNLKYVALRVQPLKVNHLALLANVPQLEECTFYFAGTHDPFYDDVLLQAVEYAKCLSTIKVTLTTGHYKFGIYPNLVEARLTHGFRAKPLTIYLNKKNTSKELFARLGQKYRPDIIEIREFN